MMVIIFSILYFMFMSIFALTAISVVAIFWAAFIIFIWEGIDEEDRNNMEMPFPARLAYKVLSIFAHNYNE